tara:strand:- start:680 stop:1102 length:423 start_codon:yes stop_codon:yes gene_type:complete
MKILKTTLDPQTIEFIPRRYNDTGTLAIRDESTNMIRLYNLDLTQVGDLLSITESFELVEGRMYEFAISSDPNVWGNISTEWQLNDLLWNNVSANIDYTLYRDKIFCTDENVDQRSLSYYKINKGQFKSDDSFDNDYIII